MKDRNDDEVKSNKRQRIISPSNSSNRNQLSIKDEIISALKELCTKKLITDITEETAIMFIKSGNDDPELMKGIIEGLGIPALEVLKIYQIIDRSSQSFQETPTARSDMDLCEKVKKIVIDSLGSLENNTELSNILPLLASSDDISFIKDILFSSALPDPHKSKLIKQIDNMSNQARPSSPTPQDSKHSKIPAAMEPDIEDPFKEMQQLYQKKCAGRLGIIPEDQKPKKSPKIGDGALWEVKTNPNVVKLPPQDDKVLQQHLKILGLDPLAPLDLDAVKKAYHANLKIYHSDKREKSEESEAITRDLNAAAKYINDYFFSKTQTNMFDDDDEFFSFTRTQPRTNFSPGKYSEQDSWLLAYIKQGNLKELAKWVSEKTVNQGILNLKHNITTTLLYHAVCCTQPFVPHIVKFLLELKADPNLKYDTNTPLHEAVMGGNSEIIKLLIEHDAEVDGLDKYGFSALTWITGGRSDALEKNNINNIELLLAAGADPNRKYINGETPSEHISKTIHDVSQNYLKGPERSEAGKELLNTIKVASLIFDQRLALTSGEGEKEGEDKLEAKRKSLKKIASFYAQREDEALRDPKTSGLLVPKESITFSSSCLSSGSSISSSHSSSNSSSSSGSQSGFDGLATSLSAGLNLSSSPTSSSRFQPGFAFTPAASTSSHSSGSTQLLSQNSQTIYYGQSKMASIDNKNSLLIVQKMVYTVASSIGQITGSNESYMKFLSKLTISVKTIEELSECIKNISSEIEENYPTFFSSRSSIKVGIFMMQDIFSGISSGAISAFNLIQKIPDHSIGFSNRLFELVLRPTTQGKALKGTLLANNGSFKEMIAQLCAKIAGSPSLDEEPGSNFIVLYWLSRICTLKPSEVASLIADLESIINNDYINNIREYLSLIVLSLKQVQISQSFTNTSTHSMG